KFYKKKEEISLVRHFPTGRLCLHPDHRPCSNHKNIERNGRRLLSWHYSCLWIFPWDYWNPFGREQKAN
ncbi:hypothetical protein NDU88_005826, partial [Pleurodeles waltl]